MITRALASALFLSTLWAGEPARPAPAFTMLRLNQPSIRLSQYRGKVVALAFIATTCPHCQQFTVELNQIDRDYSHRGVQIVECAFNDEGPQAMREFLERFEPRFPVTYSTPAAVSAFLQRTMLDPRPLRVPVLVLIDRAGMIREEIGGEDNFFQNPGANLRAKLDKMLAR
jgi:peroxiredoxin